MTVDRPASTPPPARPSAAAPPLPLPGLSGLRAHLDRVVRRHRLRSLLVVVDDPDLGRQAFRAGAGTIATGVVAAGPGVTTDPPLSSDDLDADMLMALCAMSLHLQLLGEVEDVDDDGELALRRLPGVYAVALERDGDLTLCHVFATADAPEDVARRAAEAITASTGAKVVVELRRDPPTTLAAPPPTAPPAPILPAVPTAPPSATTVRTLTDSIAERFADATWSADVEWRPRAGRTAARVAAVSPTPASSPAPEQLRLLAVRSVPEDGDIEAHLELGTRSAVGRAPLARGLAGATEAVLQAMSTLDPTVDGWVPAWVRTVETTAEGRFVVAASLSGPSGDHRHGIATGTTPIDGAARATTAAMAETPVSASGGSPTPPRDG